MRSVSKVYHLDADGAAWRYVLRWMRDAKLSPLAFE